MSVPRCRVSHTLSCDEHRLSPPAQPVLSLFAGLRRSFFVLDGTLFLTNQRLIFMGRRKNKNIRLNRILDFEIYSNGVQIEKDAGVSPFLETSADMELLGLLLGRAIRDVM